MIVAPAKPTNARARRAQPWSVFCASCSAKLAPAISKRESLPAPAKRVTNNQNIKNNETISPFRCLRRGRAKTGLQSGAGETPSAPSRRCFHDFGTVGRRCGRGADDTRPRRARAGRDGGAALRHTPRPVHAGLSVVPVRALGQGGARDGQFEHERRRVRRGEARLRGPARMFSTTRRRRGPTRIHRIRSIERLFRRGTSDANLTSENTKPNKPRCPRDAAAVPRGAAAAGTSETTDPGRARAGRTRKTRDASENVKPKKKTPSPRAAVAPRRRRRGRELRNVRRVGSGPYRARDKPRETRPKT